MRLVRTLLVENVDSEVYVRKGEQEMQMMFLRWGLQRPSVVLCPDFDQRAEHQSDAWDL